MQFTGSRPRIGWRSTVAGVAPNPHRSSSRAFTQSCPAASPQWVKTETLSPAAKSALEYSSRAVPRQTLVDALGDLVRRLGVERDARDGPERAEPDDAPSKSGSPRRSATISPAEVTSSSARTAVARLPLRSPEPWVAVAIAPATAMCGSEARLCSARPCGMQRLGQLAVADGAAAGDPVVADLDRGREPVERDELVGVGDGVERVARAEDADPLRARRPAPPARPPTPGGGSAPRRTCGSPPSWSPPRPRR